MTTTPSPPAVKFNSTTNEPTGEHTTPTVQQRGLDADASGRCQIVIEAFLHDINAKFPTTAVSLHNSPQDTIALTFSRMIMAHTLIAGTGTFPFFPALANFGASYVLVAPGFRKSNHWFAQLATEESPAQSHLHVVEDTDSIESLDLMKLWEADPSGGLVVQWFRNTSSV
jgi:hypothetical protein